MSSVDPILDLLDAALAPDDHQDSPEAHIYTDVAPALPDAGTCWRCTTHPTAEGSELCAGCRAFMLEDSDHDPAARTADLDARGRTFDPPDGVARLRPTDGDPITIIATTTEQGQAWTALGPPVPSAMALSQILGPFEVRVIDARYQAEQMAQEFEVAAQRLADALATTTDDLAARFQTGFQIGMAAMGWTAEEFTDTLIRLFDAQPPADLERLAATDDEPADDEPPPEPRNRAERRAEQFSHHAATARPGPRPAWTHRLNSR